MTTELITLEYAAMLANNGGMATCGNHLGVYVGTDVKATPVGWTFVEMPTTAERVQEAIDHTKLGKSTWPDKVKHGEPKGRPV